MTSCQYGVAVQTVIVGVCKWFKFTDFEYVCSEIVVVGVMITILLWRDDDVV